MGCPLDGLSFTDHTSSCACLWTAVRNKQSVRLLSSTSSCSGTKYTQLQLANLFPGVAINCVGCSCHRAISAVGSLGKMLRLVETVPVRVSAIKIHLSPPENLYSFINIDMLEPWLLNGVGSMAIKLHILRVSKNPIWALLVIGFEHLKNPPSPPKKKGCRSNRWACQTFCFVNAK